LYSINGILGINSSQESNQTNNTNNNSDNSKQRIVSLKRNEEKNNSIIIGL